MFFLVGLILFTTQHRITTILFFRCEVFRPSEVVDVAAVVFVDVVVKIVIVPIVVVAVVVSAVRLAVFAFLLLVDGLTSRGVGEFPRWWRGFGDLL